MELYLFYYQRQRGESSLASQGVSHVMTFDLDLYFQAHSALTLKIVSTL